MRQTLVVPDGLAPLVERPAGNEEDHGYRMLAAAVIRQAVIDLAPSVEPRLRESARRFLGDLPRTLWGDWVGGVLPRPNIAALIEAEWAGRATRVPGEAPRTWPAGSWHHMCACGGPRGVHGPDGCGHCDDCTTFTPRARARAAAGE